MDTTHTPDPGVVADVRRWVRAYPRRWRREREEEVLGLVLDLAEPGARRLGTRDRLGLLAGGLATRWRTRPPWGAWLAYRLVGRRIPRPWVEWAADDIDGYWYPLRCYLAALWWLPLVAMGDPDGLVPVLPILVAMPLVMQFLGSEHLRGQARSTHVVLRPGDPWAHPGWLERPVRRRRAEAASATTWAVMVLVAAAVTGLLGSLAGSLGLVLEPVPGRAASWELVTVPLAVPPVGFVALLGAGVVVGVVLAVLARTRWLRAADARPAQPHRELRPLSLVARVRLTLGVVVLAAVAGAEVSGTLIVGLGPVCGAVALALLPGAVLAARAGRRAQREGDPVAAVDLWRVMVRGGPVTADRPTAVAEPWPTSGARWAGGPRGFGAPTVG